MKSYRCGIIGTGGVSMAHSVGYHYGRQTRLVSVCDIRPEQLARYFEWASKLPHALEAGVTPDNLTQYDDFLDMVETEQLDLASVCTQIDSHCEIVLKLVEQGVVTGIVCEKPIAQNLADAERMVEACERAGVTLAVGHQRRFGPQFRKPVQLIRSGAIGELQWVWASAPSRWPDPLFYGTHTADLLLMYGGQVDWVMGQIGEIMPEPAHQGGYPVGFPVVGYMRFKNGALGLFETERDRSQFHIVGTEGQIMLRETKLREAVHISTARTDGWEPVKIDAENAEWLAGDEGCERYFGVLFDDLVESVEQARPPVSDGRNAIAALELLLSIYESARVRGRVTMPLANRGFPLEQW